MFHFLNKHAQYEESFPCSSEVVAKNALLYSIDPHS